MASKSKFRSTPTKQQGKLAAGETRIYTLTEGQVLSLSGSSDVSGRSLLVDSTAPATPVAPGAQLPIGPFTDTQRVQVICTTGSIDALTQDASAAALKPLLLGVFGQSNERSSIYPTLNYVPSAFSGNGSVATLTISTTNIVSNNLPIGETFLGRVTGAVPAGYNTDGFVPMTVVGTWPNGQVTYASTATGALTTAGALVLDQKATYPEMFGSRKFPTDTAPIAPSLSVLGGWWHGVSDELVGAGYQANLVNGAIGGMSFIKHACGQVTLWQPLQQYRVARAPMGNGDNGCMGELVRTSTGILLECTGGGNKMYATYQGSVPIKDGNLSTYSLDYILNILAGSSGIAEPSWGTPAVGATFNDGTVTWTVRSPSIAADADPSIKALNTGSSTPVCAEGNYGFDPFGIIARFTNEMGRVRGSGKRVICLQNGQSDISASQAAYQNALIYLSNYFASRGYIVLVGLTLFQPAAGAANYNKLSAARIAALAALKATWPNNVFDGADLYAGLGNVHGSNNLYLESDTRYPNENTHIQGRTGRAIVPMWANAIKAIL